MRIHLHIDDELVDRLDARVGARARSRFVEEAIRRALDDADGWGLILSAAGTIADEGHEWDEDPAAWVHEQRFADGHRVG